MKGNANGHMLYDSRLCSLSEKEMTSHSSVLAWRTPGTGEPHGLQSVGCTESDDWSDLAAAACCLCLSIIQSVLIRCRIFMIPYWAPNCLRLLGEAPVVILWCLGHRCRSWKVSVFILQPISELSWVCLRWSSEISLHPFQPGLPLLLLSNFLPNRYMYMWG